MSSGKPSNTNIYHWIVTSVLIFIIFYFLLGLHNQSIEKDKQLYEFKIREDSLFRELSRSAEERHLLVLRADSLNSVSQNLSTKLTATKQELSSIRGRYKAWSNDSLAQEMNRRAGQ